MVIKVLFVVLMLSTAAIVAVGLAIHFRVKRHLDGTTAETETPAVTAEVSGQDDTAAQMPERWEKSGHGQSSDEGSRQSR